MSATTFHPIGSVPRGRLTTLFDEEATTWACGLRWNFEPNRKRLEAALDGGTLKGLVVGDEVGPCAYATYSADEEHGSLGSFFVSERAREGGIEVKLVRETLNCLLILRPGVIDCQTLFSSDPGLIEPFLSQGFDSAARIYMIVDRSAWLAKRQAIPGDPRTKPIHRTDLRPVARLVYEAHLESRALDASSSFDTLDSCERILRQIISDEVCGPFDSPGSRRVDGNGEVLAASLLTWPMPEVAHVSEVATAPTQRRRGLARHCLSESLASAFERRGAAAVTLSVTASNLSALALYESMGFSPHIRYGSHVLRTVR